jgi:hypothetical protein
LALKGTRAAQRERMEQLHAIGALVRIDGLKDAKGQQLNGKTGVVLQYSARTDRYNVRMDDQNVNANLRSVNIKRVRRKRAREAEKALAAVEMLGEADAGSFLGIQEEGEYYPISDDESDEDDEDFQAPASAPVRQRRTRAATAAADVDPCEQAARQAQKPKAPAEAKATLPAYLTKLSALARSARIGHRKAFQRTEGGVFHDGMPLEALRHIVPIDQATLNAAQSDWLVDTTHTGEDTKLERRIVGSTDPRRDRTTKGCAAPNECLDGTKCKYHVAESGEVTRQACADHPRVMPPTCDTVPEHVNPAHQTHVFAGMRVVVTAIADQFGLQDDQAIELARRCCIMCHPAAPVLSSKKGLGIHIDNTCAYNVQAVVRTSNGWSFCLFFIAGKWCALCYPPGVSGYLISRSLTIKHFHLVPAHEQVRSTSCLRRSTQLTQCARRSCTRFCSTESFSWAAATTSARWTSTKCAE